MAGENVGKAFVEFRGDDRYLEKDLKEALAKLPNDYTIKFRATLDSAQVRAELDKIAAENLDIRVHLNLDDTEAKAKLAALKAEAESMAIKINSDVDTQRAIQDVRQIGEDTRTNPLTIHTEADTSVFEREIERVVQDISSSSSRSVITPHVNSLPARAELAELTRPRFVDIIPKIPGDVMKGLKGLGYSLVGAIPIATYTEAISELAANFESGVAKADIFLTKIMSISGAIGGAAESTFAFAGDVLNLIGYLAMGPAAFTGLVSGMVVLRESFKGFAQALGGSKAALAKFPADVQNVILQLREITKDFKQPIQSAFWDNVGNTLIKLAKDDLPTVRNAFTDTAKQLGNIFDSVLNGMDRWVKGGGFKEAFDNINQGWANAGRGAGAFTDALNTLTTVGSKFLPAFGDSVARVADRFNNFIQNAAKTGEITAWIGRANTAFHELSSVLKSTTSIFNTITDASREAGAGGLAVLASGLSKVADFMKSEPFRSQFVFFLGEVHQGAKLLESGLGAVSRALGNISSVLGKIIQTGSGAGGAFLKDLAAFLSAPRLGDGVLTALTGFKSALEAIKPAFTDLGNAIGDLGTIAGPMVQATAEGLAHMVHTVSEVIAGLRDGFAAAIPVFNNFAQGIIAVASGPIIAFAKIIGDILLTFANLPGPLQTVIMTLGLLALALPKINNFFNGVKKGASDMREAFNNSWARDITDAMARPFMGEGPIPKDSLGNLSKVIKDFVAPIASEVGAAWGLVGDATKNLASKMGQAFKGAFQDIAAGAALVGEAMKNSLVRGWDDAVSKVKAIAGNIKDVADKIGSAIGSAFDAAKGKLVDLGNAIGKFFAPAGQVIRDVGEQIAKDFGAAMSKIGQGLQGLGKLISAPFVSAYNAAADWTQKMIDKITSGTSSMISKIAGAVKGWAIDLAKNVSDGFNAAVESVKNFTARAVAPIGEFLGKVGDIAKGIGSVVGAIGSVIGQKLGDGIKGAISGIAGQFAELGRILMDQSPIVQGVVKGYEKIVDAAKKTGDWISTKTAGAWQGLKDSASLATTWVGVKMLEMGDGIKNQMERARGAFGTFKTAVAETMSSVAARFEPITSAVRNLGESINQAVGLTSGGLRTIGRAASESIVAGLKNAAGGLLDALGGPWGLAVGAATTAITAWYQAQQEATQHANELSATLDKQTGAFTNATKGVIAKQALDGVTNDWDNFVRGFVERSGSVEETLGKLGTSTADYTNKLADPAGRDAYVKGINAIKTAMFAGIPITDEMAAAIGTTKENLKGLNTGDMEHLAAKAGDTAKALTQAEENTRKLAEATGTTSAQAAVLSKNFDVLRSSASSASDKFNSFKENLLLLVNANDKLSTSTKNAERDFNQSNLDLAKSIQSVKDANGGVVKNLVDVQKGFITTSQAGIDFSKAMETQRDAILKLGTDALQKALAGGKSLGDAQKIALDVMSPQIGNLTQLMKNIGLEQPQIDAVIKSLGLVPDKLTTAIGVEGGPEARAEIIRTQLAGQAFASHNYTAVLATLPDAAKKAIEDTTGLAGAFASGNYDAILAALDQTAGGREAALGSILSVTNGDYTSMLKARNVTIPGVEDAKQTVGSFTRENWMALLQAQFDHTHDPAIEAAISFLARPRTVTLVADASQVQSAADFIKVQGGHYADGGFAGSAGRAIAFANGGTFEDHVAQIAVPGVTPRVWAEAETGGEAYIPLGINKRSRSLKILEQVAEMFGLSLSKKLAFFDGGIIRNIPQPTSLMTAGSSSTSSTPGPRSIYGAPAGSVNVNVYPSQGLSEEQIGNSAASALYWQFMSRPR